MRETRETRAGRIATNGSLRETRVKNTVSRRRPSTESYHIISSLRLESYHIISSIRLSASGYGISSLRRSPVDSPRDQMRKVWGFFLMVTSERSSLSSLAAMTKSLACKPFTARDHSSMRTPGPSM